MNCRKTGGIILIWLISAVGCLKPPGVNLPVPDLDKQAGTGYSSGTLFKVDSCYQDFQDEYLDIEIDGFVPPDLKLADSRQTAAILKEAARFSFSQEDCPDAYGRRVIQVFLYPRSDPFRSGNWVVYARSAEIGSLEELSWPEIINYRQPPPKPKIPLTKQAVGQKPQVEVGKKAAPRPMISEKQRQKLEKAIAAQTRLIEKNPGNAALYNNRGNLYYAAGLLHRALEDFSKAIDLDPHDAAAFNNRGNTYDRMGETQKAIADLTKAIEIDPKYEQAYYNRGTIYEKIGLQQRAIEDLDRALALNGKDYKAYFHKATALEKLNRTQEAVEVLRKFLIYVPPEFKIQIEYAKNKIEMFEKRKSH